MTRAADGATASERVQRLSSKERACLRLVARRLSSKQIAAELGIAKTSVDTYCNRARAKLEAADRYEAARLLETELGPAPPAPSPPARGESRAGAALSPGRADRRRAARLRIAFAASALLGLATLLAGLRALREMEPVHRGHLVSPHDLAKASVHAR